MLLQKSVATPPRRVALEGRGRAEGRGSLRRAAEILFAARSERKC